MKYLLTLLFALVITCLSLQVIIIKDIKELYNYNIRLNLMFQRYMEYEDKTPSIIDKQEESVEQNEV